MHANAALISRYADSFDFWRSSRLATVAAGLPLGLTPRLRNKVRATTRRGLAAWMTK